MKTENNKEVKVNLELRLISRLQNYIVAGEDIYDTVSRLVTTYENMSSSKTDTYKAFDKVVAASGVSVESDTTIEQIGDRVVSTINSMSSEIAKIATVLMPEDGDPGTQLYIKVKKLANRLKQEKSSRLSLEDYVRSADTFNPVDIDAYINDLNTYIKACEDQIECLFDQDDDQTHYTTTLLSSIRMAAKTIAKKNLSYGMKD